MPVKLFSKVQNLVILLALLSGGLAIRLLIAKYHPLWLDEKYSLLFAGLETPLQHFFQSKDTHPGTYYLILKGLLFLTKDVLLLRFVSVILPQLIGISVLAFWMVRRKFHSKVIYLTLAGLLFNPFFVYLSIQLRMYSWELPIAIFTYIAVKEWQKNPTYWRNRFAIFSTLFLGNSFEYAFYFLTAGILSYLLFEEFRKTKRLSLWPIIFGCIFALQFFVLSGVSVKRKFEAASWIPTPNVVNTSSLFWTVNGVEVNVIGLSDRSINFQDLLFYGALFAGIFYSWRLFQRKKFYVVKSTFLTEFIFLILLPSLLLFVGSFLMSILSQRMFFYLFVPKLSLFLPRVFLPIVVVAYVLLPQKISSWLGRFPKYNATILVAFILIISAFWIQSYKEIFKLSEALERQEIEHLELITQAQKQEGQTYFLPSWVLLSAVTPQQLPKYPEIQKEVEELEAFEVPYLNGLIQSCEQLGSKNIIYTDFTAETIKPLYEKNMTILDSCCQKEVDSTGTLHWKCGN